MSLAFSRIISKSASRNRLCSSLINPSTFLVYEPSGMMSKSTSSSGLPVNLLARMYFLRMLKPQVVTLKRPNMKEWWSMPPAAHLSTLTNQVAFVLCCTMERAFVTYEPPGIVLKTLFPSDLPVNLLVRTEEVAQELARELNWRPRAKARPRSVLCPCREGHPGLSCTVEWLGRISNGSKSAARSQTGLSLKSRLWLPSQTCPLK